MLGYKVVKEQVETGDLTWPNIGNEKYVHSWRKREEDRMRQIEHMEAVLKNAQDSLDLAKKEASDSAKLAEENTKIARWAMYFAGASALVAIAALFIGS